MNLLEKKDFIEINDGQFKLIYNIRNEEAVDRLIKAERVLEHLEKLNQSILDELIAIREGTERKPQFKHLESLHEDILTQRYEYLENLQGHVDFTLNYPERGHQV